MAGKKQKPHWLGKHLTYQKEEFSKFSISGGLRYKMLAELLPMRGVSRALEVGCGHNPLISALPESTEKFAIDLADVKPKGIRVLRRNAEAEIPFPDGHFGLVVACEIIEHLYETGKFLRECNRVLCNGGTLILSTPNIGSMRNVARGLRGKQLKYLEYDVGGTGHIRYYTCGSLLGQVGECGFSVEKFTSDDVYIPLHHHVPPIGWLGLRIAPLIPQYGDSLIVRARKK